MVYKKIRNKIPSLSSLLLAGVLLGSNCTDKNEKAGEDTIKNTEQETEGEKPKDASGKEISQHYLSAIKNIYSYLVNSVLMVNRLDNQPYNKINENDLQGLNAKQALSTLSKHFSAVPNGNIYPRSLKDIISAVENKEFPKHYYAHGIAFKSISDVWVQFHKFYKEAQKLINNGAPETEMAKILEGLHAYYKKTVVSDEAVFKPDYKFYDSKRVSLLKGPQLGRFLTDSTVKLADKGPNDNKYGMPGVLGNVAKTVWITGRPDSDPDSLPKLDKVACRGAGIGKEWVVAGASQAPHIAPFPVYSKVTQKFKFDKTSNFSDGIASKTAPVQEDITFGQFLNTLFSYNSEKKDSKGSMDFISFSPHPQSVQKPDAQWINIDSDNAVFQKVYNLTKNTSLDSQFSSSLASHILDTPQLRDLFPIPDVNSILELMIPDFRNIDGQKPFNEGGTDKIIGNKSLSIEFLKKCLAMFTSESFDDKDLVSSCEELVDATDAILKSDLNIDQKIALKAIKFLFTPKDQTNSTTNLLYNTAQGSAKVFIEYLEKEVEKEANFAVLYKKDGVYVSTDATRLIQSSINKMYDALNRKRGAAYVTYSKIGLEIKNVVNAMDNDYQLLKSILTSKVNTFLGDGPKMLEQGVCRAYFPDIDFTSPVIDDINKFKTDYLDQNKS